MSANKLNQLLPKIQDILNDENLAVVPSRKSDLKKIYSDPDFYEKLNEFNTIVNTPPNAKWLKNHPTAKTDKGQPILYMPIGRIEWLLTYVFLATKVTVKSVQVIANSVVVTITLHVLHPVLAEWQETDGVGAAPINTKAGAGPTDFANILASSVQTATPAAKSYAIKDAAETLGKLFGKDLNRADEISYSTMSTRFDETPKPLN